MSEYQGLRKINHPAPPVRERAAETWPLNLNELMDADFLPQPRDLVLDVQFAPFELCDLQIVGRRVGQCFADFLL